MSTAAAEFQFAAEFAALAVAAAGFLLVVVRARAAAGVLAAAAPARVALAVGFAGAGTVAVLTGADIVGPRAAVALGLTRGGAGLALLAGSAGLRSSRTAARTLGLGAAVLAGAGACLAAATGETTVDGILVASSVLLACGLAVLTRRSVAARVAAASAGTLIVIVLVLSVALASITTSSVLRSSLQSLGSRAGVEVASLRTLSASAAMESRLIAVDLSGFSTPSAPDPLVEGVRATPVIAARLAQLRSPFPSVASPTWAPTAPPWPPQATSRPRWPPPSPTSPVSSSRAAVPARVAPWPWCAPLRRPWLRSPWPRPRSAQRRPAAGSGRSW